MHTLTCKNWSVKEKSWRGTVRACARDFIADWTRRYAWRETG